MPPRRLLIVSYDFPPSSIGIWRTLKLCRYMGEFGWRPAVLTVRDVRTPRWDPGPLAELPEGTPIRRTESLDQNRLAFLASKAIGSLKGKPAVGGAARPAAKSTNAALRGAMDVLRAWALVPDDRAGWYPFALAEGRRWLRSAKFDAVYTTSFPNTAHLVGARLAREFNLPLIADFRDIWVGNYYFYHPATPWHDRLQRRLERSVIETAAAVVSVTGPITADFRERYPDQPPAKFHTITNGFDPEDFEGVIPRPGTHVYTIAYAGTMYGGTSPEGFLRGVRRLLKAEPRWRAVLRLRFVGAMIEPYRAMIDRFGLADITRVDPYLAHGEALQAMADADALLLIVSPEKGSHIMLTQKVFEYAAARRPVIGLVPEGAARDFLQEIDEGPIAPPTDSAAVARILRAELTRWNREGRRVLPPNPALAKYERKSIAERLCGVFDTALLSEPPAPAPP